MVGYGCTTCIGNSGPLDPAIEEAIDEPRSHHRRRAFGQPEFRGAHPSEHQGEFPHVAAAGGGVRAGGAGGYRSLERADRPRTKTAQDVYLRDLWPTPRGSARRDDIGAHRRSFPAALPRFRRAEPEVERNSPPPAGDVYQWDAESDYIAEPPFFTDFAMQPSAPGDDRERAAARHLRRFGDDRPHLARRRDQGQLARRQISGEPRRGAAPISTPTAAAAEMTTS